jgi:hypothetical protein
MEDQNSARFASDLQFHAQTFQPFTATFETMKSRPNTAL